MTKYDDDTPITNDDDGAVNLNDQHQEERDLLGLDNQEDDELL